MYTRLQFNSSGLVFQDNITDNNPTPLTPPITLMTIYLASVPRKCQRLVRATVRIRVKIGLGFEWRIFTPIEVYIGVGLVTPGSFLYVPKPKMSLYRDRDEVNAVVL